MFVIGQGLLWIILFNYLKSAMILTVTVFLGIMKHVADHSESFSNLLRTTSYTSLFTYLFTVFHSAPSLKVSKSMSG